MAIIDYDRRPDATIDEKLQSLIQSIMRAFNEMDGTLSAYGTSLELADQKAVKSDTIAGLADRVAALEEMEPEAPASDGVYVHTVTVSSGVPTYTWESEGE